MRVSEQSRGQEYFGFGLQPEQGNAVSPSAWLPLLPLPVGRTWPKIVQDERLGAKWVAGSLRTLFIAGATAQLLKWIIGRGDGIWATVMVPSDRGFSQLTDCKVQRVSANLPHELEVECLLDLVARRTEPGEITLPDELVGRPYRMRRADWFGTDDGVAADVECRRIHLEIDARLQSSWDGMAIGRTSPAFLNLAGIRCQGVLHGDISHPAVHEDYVATKEASLNISLGTQVYVMDIKLPRLIYQQCTATRIQFDALGGRDGSAPIVLA